MGILLILSMVLACAAPLANADVLGCMSSRMGPSSSALRAPWTAEYNRTLFIDNRRAEVYPAAVVWPSGASDIAAAMSAAQDCHVRFAVISGGHSAQGYGLVSGGVTINLRAIGGGPRIRYSVDNTTGEHLATIPSGTRFRDVYAALAERRDGRVIIGGGCPQVAIGGFVLGGGWSFISRSYGMAIDRVRAIDLLLPNGTRTLVSAASPDKDLWWALRGGGGGNFGVALSFTVAMVKPVPRSTVGELCWPQYAGVAERAMGWWLATIRTMPREVLLDPCWLPLGPNRTRFFCFTVVCNAQRDVCAPWLARAKAAAVAAPVLDTVKIQRYLTWQRNNVNVTDAQEGYLYLKSFIFNRGQLTVGVVRTLQRALEAAPSKRSLVLFHVGGGAIADVAGDATAFPHRNCTALLQVKAIWTHPSEQAANVAWLDLVAAAVTPHTDGGAYVNYIDARLKNWPEAYYTAPGYRRLLHVKRRVDPLNVFTFNQSIGAHTPQ